VKYVILLSIAIFLQGICETAKGFPLNEVKFEGVPAELLEQVKTIAATLPGDEFEQPRLDRSREKVTEFLQSKGYPENKVAPELVKKGDQHYLLFSVKLGNPLKMRQIRFDSKEESLSSDLVLKLSQAADLKAGEIFDRERIKEMKRSVETALTAYNFIDSRVSEITFEMAKEGLIVHFQLELGQKVVLSVQGNHYFTRAELMAFVDAQRAMGLGRDFIGVIMNRLKSEYVDHGFRQVKINPYSFEAMDSEPKKVVFEIEEGPQVSIKTVEFDGNEVFTDEELVSLFLKTAPDRIQARIYNAKLVEDAGKSLIEELKKRGYLSAKMVAIKTEDLADLSKVKVRCFLSEGIQTHIQAIDLRGSTILDQKRLFELLGLTEGEPLSLPKLEDGLERIKREYRNLGYLDFKFANEASNQIVSYSEKNQYAYLTLELSEGPMFTLGGYEIFGNEFTRRKVIERELAIRVGEPLGDAKVLETEERLRRLGIFSQVSLEVQDGDSTVTAKKLKVSVQEAVPGSNSVGIGFRNDLGVRVFGGVSYSNLWGLNHTWSLDLTANRRIADFRFVEYTAQVGYSLPWFFWGPTTFKPSFSAEKRQYLEFDAETIGFNASLERMLYNPLKLSGMFMYTLERVRQFNAVDATQNQQITIGSITPTFRVDLRDNSLSPKSGFYGLTSFEYANSFLGTQKDPIPVSYGRFRARADYYFDFIPHIVWYCSVRGGWLKNFINPYQADGSIDPRITVPLIKQFALGGVNSIRGFEEQELNVQASDKDRRVQGYSTYVNYRTQMDFFATQNLSVGPFLDSGNLQVDAFSLGNLRFGTGVGMRYLTPVGPVNFDWGFKIQPRPGESTNVFYFSLGVI
jgi:outer membrane protein insertion porin family